MSPVDFEVLSAEKVVAVLAFEGEKIDEMARREGALVAYSKEGGVAFRWLSHDGG